MNTSEAYFRLRQVAQAVKTGFTENGFMMDPHDVELTDPTDPNEIQLNQELHGILNHLESVCTLLNYYDRPVLATGKLYKKSNGRFQLGGVELTSGQSIELLVYDPEWDTAPHWVRTRVEFDTDYYTVYQHTALEGKTVRIRE